ncbi:MAG: hypothetical protein J5496_02970 [Lachnospiraceae bacterium]|nr:hypothetical protein [Lachnospiraceae bacterium]
MQKPNVICHEEQTAFLDALESCLSSGLAVLMDGVPQTKESLKKILKEKGNRSWTGTILLGDRGDLKGLSFTAES